VKPKLQFIFAVSSVCLFIGCSADKETIHFSDERQPLGPRAKTAPPPPKKLNKQELFDVELAIYGYLLQRHFWDGGEYSAVFLQGDDDKVDALIKKFPNHNPPIKTSDRAELQPNRAPIDKDTGKPAMILSVDALDPTDDTVEAIGKWYAGGAVSGFYTFSLRKVGGNWIIESVQ
jgi:hypothetical protein